MSSDSAQAFVQKLISDEGLRNQLLSYLQQGKLPTLAEIVTIAGKLGYDFNLADLTSVTKDNPAFDAVLKGLIKQGGLDSLLGQELSASEIDTIAGGGKLLGGSGK